MRAQDADAAAGDAERTCWCLFRLSVLSQGEGGKHFHRESYGRFSTDAKQADSASLGWNDFLSMDAFADPAAGYLQVLLHATLHALSHVGVSFLGVCAAARCLLARAVPMPRVSLFERVY